MIYIVIPVFNRVKFTTACLSSLLAQTYKEYKVIVVDHGSTDGTSETIEKDFTEVILLKGTSDLWWTGATNMGVTEALKLSTSTDDFVLSLNNDLVVDPDYLEQLLHVYEQHKPCLVGSTSVYFNNPERIQFAGTFWDPVFAKFKSSPLTQKPYTIAKQEAEVVKSDLLTGRGTLIPISAFRDYGLYDEKKFPHYAADEDFSLTCKKKGYDLLVAIKAVVKSHVADTGLNFTHQRLSFKQFFKTLSSIKSANNLSIRYNWAKKNTPLPYLYFSIDVFRIFGSYCRSLMIK
jgi:GT2 family glycosyltransferase